MDFDFGVTAYLIFFAAAFAAGFVDAIAGGQMLWAVGLLMGAGQVLGAYFGSNMVMKKDVKFIRTMFLIVVGATILKLVYGYFFA